MIEAILKLLLVENEENNIPDITDNPYGNGYYEGYHDAVVDVMNKLNIQHEEKYYIDHR